MTKGTIYAIWDVDLDRPIYVGQTRQKPSARWEQHRTRRTKISQHIRAKGANRFRFEVVETVHVLDLDAREAHWVVALGTMHPDGMNQRKGGANGGFSPLARAAVAAASNAMWQDPERREAARAKSHARWADPEYRARMAAKRREMWADPEFKARMKAKQRVAQNRPELKAAQAAMMRDKWADPEFREANRAAISQGWAAR